MNGEAADEGWGDRRSVLDVSVEICQPHGPGGRGREAAGQAPLEEPQRRHVGCPQSQEEGPHSCHPAWGPEEMLVCQAHHQPRLMPGTRRSGAPSELPTLPCPQIRLL